jgi:hypothetical protein
MHPQFKLKNMKKCLLYLVASLFILAARSQNAGINNDNSAPNPSAMLDVKSTNKGVLFPRVALTGTGDVATIASPATSLLVYNMSTAGSGVTAIKPGFYYWNSVAWTPLTPTSNEWSLNGNTGTIDGTNFLGTTNNVPLTFRVNNEMVGRIDPSKSNAFWGRLAGASITTGTSNTASGHNALSSNTTGSYNTASGQGALSANSSGSFHTAVGQDALHSNVFGSQNTAFGASTLQKNSGGNFNTASGVGALQDNFGGSGNTASGVSALQKNLSGSSNTAIGQNALVTNSIDSSNTAVGYGADVSAYNLTNAMALGFGAVVNASNRAQIGNASVTDVFFGNGTTTILHANATVTPSDNRFKYNIKKNVPGLDFITSLSPVTYYFDNEKLSAFTQTGIISNSMVHSVTYTGEQQLHSGFLAQDVEKVAKALGYSFDGLYTPKTDKDHYGLSYSQFVVPLVKAVQEQQAQIQELQTEKIQQQKQLDQKQEQLDILKARLDKLEKQL